MKQPPTPPHPPPTCPIKFQVEVAVFLKLVLPMIFVVCESYKE